jgi:hypothetical protein
VFTPLDVPFPDASTQANGINSRGQIVGFYSDSGVGEESHGFLATPKKNKKK